MSIKNTVKDKNPQIRLKISHRWFHMIITAINNSVYELLKLEDRFLDDAVRKAVEDERRSADSLLKYLNDVRKKLHKDGDYR